MSTDDLPHRTGWPAGMLQDDDRKLSKALADPLEARLRAKPVSITTEAATFHAKGNPPGWREFMNSLRDLRAGGHVSIDGCSALIDAAKKLAMTAWETSASDMEKAAVDPHCPQHGGSGMGCADRSLMDCTCGVAASVASSKLVELGWPDAATSPQPVYYVAHPDGTFTVADPQPIRTSGMGGDANG